MGQFTSEQLVFIVEQNYSNHCPINQNKTFVNGVQTKYKNQDGQLSGHQMKKKLQHSKPKQRSFMALKKMKI